MWPTQESCLIGRLRVGLLRGEGELSEAEKNGLRSFSSTPTGLCASGSEKDGRRGWDIDRGMNGVKAERSKHGGHRRWDRKEEKERKEHIESGFFFLSPSLKHRKVTSNPAHGTHSFLCDGQNLNQLCKTFKYLSVPKLLLRSLRLPRHIFSLSLGQYHWRQNKF